ncbi:MAG: DUF4254 domain-containing protein [Chitinophagaceae bacterium]|nr:MAG: DUF4254 domain-containing protein [Chitinophagaceae bacterium]
MEINNWVNIFQQSINDYHVKDDVDAEIQNPYAKDSIEYLMYFKNWVDTVQWHLEDIIRDPNIQPEEALKIKRRIDTSNQVRTDMVEYIDGWFFNEFKDVKVAENATFNTESPAWAIDRLSILALKIYHMQAEVDRADASEAHKNACNQKLQVLLTQNDDLILAISQLLKDIQSGKKYMRVYKQMKMYNDESLNPVLYQKK